MAKWGELRIQTVEDSNASTMTCPLCEEKCRLLKVLPCAHTFCQGCLQAVAGTASSFPCPYCRTRILVPPGGVAALQTNFYVQGGKDAADQSAPRRLLCDVCSEDREATHTCQQCEQQYCLPCRKIHDSIKSCRGHSFVPLKPDEEEETGMGKGRSRAGVTGSPHTDGVRKQGNQVEATCSLKDKGSQIKATLEGKLGDIAAQIERLEALLAAADSRCRAIDKQQEQAERDIRNRAETLSGWVNQSRDQAVKSAQLTATDMKSPLLGYSQRVRHKRAELTARHEHLTRVLQEGNYADRVYLVAQRRADCLDKADMAQMEKDLGKGEPRLRLRHESAAVNLTQTLAFVGVVTPSQQPRDLSQGDAAPDSEAAGAVVRRATGADDRPADEKPKTAPPGPIQSNATLKSEAVNILHASSLVADNKSAGWSQKKIPREIIYSRKMMCEVLCMCPVSNNRLWVTFREMMSQKQIKLFDENGTVVHHNDGLRVRDSLAAALGDVIISKGLSATLLGMTDPNGMMNSIDINMKPDYLVHSAACGYTFVCKDRYRDQTVNRVKFSSKHPLKRTSDIVLERNEFGKLIDVSAEEKYFAFILYGTLSVYRNEGPSDFVLCSSYGTTEARALDCRFCRIDGRELLLILVYGDNRVQVVDHADGMRFVRYLDTAPCSLKGSILLRTVLCSLKGPARLATDYDKHVWVGYKDGKIVVVDL